MTEAYHAKTAVPEARRARVAPLLAAGMTVREISAETNIPVGAVHRAKRQLEKIVAQGGQNAPVRAGFDQSLVILP
jgi:DNA-binding NarL/FixJ family response regulator